MLPLGATCNPDRLSTILTGAIPRAAKMHIHKGRFPHHRALWTASMERADSAAQAAYDTWSTARTEASWETLLDMRRLRKETIEKESQACCGTSGPSSG